MKGGGGGGALRNQEGKERKVNGGNTTLPVLV